MVEWTRTYKNCRSEKKRYIIALYLLCFSLAFNRSASARHPGRCRVFLRRQRDLCDETERTVCSTWCYLIMWVVVETTSKQWGVEGAGRKMLSSVVGWFFVWGVNERTNEQGRIFKNRSSNNSCILWFDVVRPSSLVCLGLNKYCHLRRNARLQ